MKMFILASVLVFSSIGFSATRDVALLKALSQVKTTDDSGAGHMFVGVDGIACVRAEKGVVANCSYAVGTAGLHQRIIRGARATRFMNDIMKFIKAGGAYQNEGAETPRSQVTIELVVGVSCQTPLDPEEAKDPAGTTCSVQLDSND